MSTTSHGTRRAARVCALAPDLAGWLAALAAGGNSWAAIAKLLE